MDWSSLSKASPLSRLNQDEACPPKYQKAKLLLIWLYTQASAAVPWHALTHRHAQRHRQRKFPSLDLQAQKQRHLVGDGRPRSHWWRATRTSRQQPRPRATPHTKPSTLAVAAGAGGARQSIKLPTVEDTRQTRRTTTWEVGRIGNRRRSATDQHCVFVQSQTILQPVYCNY